MSETKLILEMLFIIMGSAFIFESIEVDKRAKAIATIGIAFVIIGVQI